VYGLANLLSDRMFYLCCVTEGGLQGEPNLALVYEKRAWYLFALMKGKKTLVSEVK